MDRIERAFIKELNLIDAEPETTVEDVEEVEPLVDPSSVSEYLVMVKNPLSSVAEEYRKLAFQIIEATRKDFHNTILITSAMNQEGKSLVAANLAVAMASNRDISVLLMDCDLRKPSLPGYFGIDPEAGLSDYLTGRASIPDILIKMGIGRLVFLPAGPPLPNPSETLTSKKMRLLLKEVKERYRDRYIIIDSPPVLPTSESIALAAGADAILMVVRERMTRKRDVVRALSLLKGANIIGVVLNGSEDGEKAYRYYSY